MSIYKLHNNFSFKYLICIIISKKSRGCQCCGRDRMVVGFTTTYAISDLLQVCGFPISSTNKTDRHDITEILLKVVLNTIDPNQKSILEQLGI